jgi:hypothetical protein
MREPKASSALLGAPSVSAQYSVGRSKPPLAASISASFTSATLAQLSTLLITSAMCAWAAVPN